MKSTLIGFLVLMCMVGIVPQLQAQETAGEKARSQVTFTLYDLSTEVQRDQIAGILDANTAIHSYQIDTERHSVTVEAKQTYVEGSADWHQFVGSMRQPFKTAGFIYVQPGDAGRYYDRE